MPENFNNIADCQRKRPLMYVSLQKMYAHEILAHCKKYPHLTLSQAGRKNSWISWELFKTETNECVVH